MSKERVYKVLRDERRRKQEILVKYSEVEYERGKIVSSANKDNPYLLTTNKIVDLENEIVMLEKPSPIFEKMIASLNGVHRKVILDYYGNGKTVKEIQEEWEIIRKKQPSESAICTWKRDAIKQLAKKIDTF